jgi:hypothetical protein
MRGDVFASGEAGRSVYREPECDLLGIVGTKSGIDSSVVGNTQNPTSWRNVLNELRIQAYQLIGRLLFVK